MLGQKRRYSEISPTQPTDRAPPNFGSQIGVGPDFFVYDQKVHVTVNEKMGHSNEGLSLSASGCQPRYTDIYIRPGIQSYPTPLNPASVTSRKPVLHPFHVPPPSSCDSSLLGDSSLLSDSRNVAKQPIYRGGGHLATSLLGSSDSQLRQLSRPVSSSLLVTHEPDNRPSYFFPSHQFPTQWQPPPTRPTRPENNRWEDVSKPMTVVLADASAAAKLSASASAALGRWGARLQDEQHPRLAKEEKVGVDGEIPPTSNTTHFVEAKQEEQEVFDSQTLFSVQPSTWKASELTGSVNATLGKIPHSRVSEIKGGGVCLPSSNSQQPSRLREGNDSAPFRATSIVMRRITSAKTLEALELIVQECIGNDPNSLIALHDSAICSACGRMVDQNRSLAISIFISRATVWLSREDGIYGRGARNASNIFHACAKLDIAGHPIVDLLAAESAKHAQLRAIKPQEISNILWALAKLNYKNRDIIHAVLNGCVRLSKNPDFNCACLNPPPFHSFFFFSLSLCFFTQRSLNTLRNPP